MDTLIRLRAWWYQNVAKGAKPPADVRRFLMKSGMHNLKGTVLPLDIKARIGTEEIIAACDPDFAGMEGDLLQDGLSRLAEIPTVRCGKCKRPVFTHDASMINGEYRCEGCK